MRAHFSINPGLLRVVDPPRRPHPPRHFHSPVVIHLVRRMAHPRAATSARRVVLRMGAVQFRRRTGRHHPSAQIARLKIILKNDCLGQRQRRLPTGRAPIRIAHHHRIQPRVRRLYMAPAITAARRPRDARPVKPPLIVKFRTAAGRHAKRGAAAGRACQTLGLPGDNGRVALRRNHQYGVRARHRPGHIGDDHRVVAGIG